MAFHLNEGVIRWGQIWRTALAGVTLVLVYSHLLSDARKSGRDEGYIEAWTLRAAQADADVMKAYEIGLRDGTASCVVPGATHH